MVDSTIDDPTKMSEESVIQWCQKRLADLRTRAKEQTDAESKSLRSYSTAVHPLLQNRLDILGNRLNDCQPKYIATNSYLIADAMATLKDNTLLNHVFQPLFDQEEPEFGKPIYVRVSSKTRTGNATMMDATRIKITNLAMSTMSLPTIEMLARKELGDTVVSDLFQVDFRSSSLFSSIISFLALHGNMFPAGQSVSVPGRFISADLVMRSKYYPSRDDNRAFCADTNILRSLCGACLQQLFLPQNMKVRLKLSISKYVPAIKKDMLNWEFQKPPDGYVLVLLLGDVSNFTGSASNAWLMLCCMALELSVGGLKNKLPNLFAIKDTFFTATWLQIITLYLYLTVGYPCFVENRKSYSWLPGGFLGVNSNITVALVWLSVLLRSIENVRREGIKWVKSQAGGDDFAIVVCVRLNQVETIKPWIENEVLNGVGHLKDLTLIVLDDQTEGILEGQIFCRKRLKLSRTDRTICLCSEPAIPLPVSLTMDHFPRQHGAQVKLWNELDAALNEYDRLEPDNMLLTSALRTLLLDRCTHVKPVRARLTMLIPPDMQITVVGHYQISNKALAIAGMESMISTTAGLYLLELPDRIRHSLKAERTEMVKVLQDGIEQLIVITSVEAKRIRGNGVRVLEQVGLVYDNDLRSKLS
jgi:hypothetical protein